MQLEAVFKINQPDFKEKALQWANSFRVACYYDSNNYPDQYSSFDTLIACGVTDELSANAGNAFNSLQTFLDSHKSLTLGYFGYDLKNETENQQSKNLDFLQFPDLYFFVPENTIVINGENAAVTSDNPEKIWKEINEIQLDALLETGFSGIIKSRFDKEEYIKSVMALQNHIKRGDIYEINFCQEFYADRVQINPLNTFKKLNSVSPTPFSGYFKLYDKYIISATPERFLSKRGSKLISQPIKGTAKRNDDPVEDLKVIKSLKSNEKEIAENIMIVDLVRNDLTRSAKAGTVKVEEITAVYSFKQVHQLISTVVCEAESLPATTIIKNTFPMGSMTGAPKVSAMELAEACERTKRGVYSGALGYFSADGDFDFNVVIRTILYNAESEYLSFQVGGAITYDSDAEKEYDECLLKAEAIYEVLSKNKTRQ